VGLFPANGGSEEAARTDLEFYALAGQLEGDPEELQVADFWTFGPLERALDKLGRR
jgi:NitT/TauT family transport system substrate-binding protein